MTLAAPAYGQGRRPGGPGGPGGGGTIEGSIIDSSSREPLASATVAVWNAADSTLVTGAIAERDGGFSIGGVRPGDYYVKITYVGYLPRVIGGLTLRPGAMRVALGAVALAANSGLGNEVTITADREFMTIAIDKTIYKTSDIQVAAGGNTTDLLRNIPSIEVDQEGNVSLRGNQNVAIMINGRSMIMSGDALVNFLRGLPADAVERIEVIPNPSAKYDPEGMSGIINIVMKQENNRGLNGGVNGSAGTLGQYNVGGNINYGQGPWNIFANYGFNIGSHGGGGTRFRENRLVEPSTFLSQTSRNDNDRRSHNLSTSVDYAIDSASSLSAAASFNANGGTSEGLATNVEMDEARIPTGGFERTTDGESDEVGMDYRLGYKWVAEAARHELSADLRYATEIDEDHDLYLNQDLAPDGTHENDTPQRQRTRDDDKDAELSFQVDYVRPLGESARIEAGYKGELESVRRTYFSESYDYPTSAYLPDVEINNSFIYDQWLHSTYAIVGMEAGDIGAQVGLRAEQADTKFDLTTTGQTFENSYFSLFPSAFLTYKPADAILLKASYGKRITRPRTRTLNPFSSSEDPLFRRSGNPYLRPEYTHSFEFTVSHFTDRTTVTLTPYFRHTTDIIRRFERFDSSGVSISTFENFSESDSYGADLTGTLRMGEAFTGFVSLSAYRVVTDAGNVEAGLGSDAFTWSARANITLQIIKGLDLQMSHFYRPPMDIEGGRMGSHSMTDLSLQQKVFGDRGRIGLRLSDPFNMRGFDVVRDDATFFQETHRKWDSRSLNLNFSYTFGSPDKSRRARPQDRPGGDSDMEME